MWRSPGMEPHLAAAERVNLRTVTLAASAARAVRKGRSAGRRNQANSHALPTPCSCLFGWRLNTFLGLCPDAVAAEKFCLPRPAARRTLL